jgi:hypothetical protein
MNRVAAFALFAVLTSLSFAADPAKDNWTTLFDGKSLTGWTTLKGQPVTAGWTAEEGTLHLKGKGGDIYTA